MPDAMGSFRIDVEIENPARPGRREVARGILVDTGAELSWIPAGILELLDIERRKLWRFRQADGTILERWAGFLDRRVAGCFGSDGWDGSTLSDRAIVRLMA